MRIIYENNVPTRIDWELRGSIRVDDKLIWEPLNAAVCCNIKVTEVRRVDGENYYHLQGDDGSISVNEESSVRESCVRDFRNMKRVPSELVFGEE